MKSYICVLECSHTVVAQFGHHPTVNPREHAPCPTCHGLFAVLSAEVVPIPVPAAPVKPEVEPEPPAKPETPKK